MIVCQNCLHEHPDGTSYCESCGEPLSGQRPNQRRTWQPAPTIPDRPESAPATPPMISQDETWVGPPIPPPEPAADTANTGATAGTGMLYVRLNDGKTFELSGKAEYLIGRRDDERGILPDLDLTQLGGMEGGVSRAHALIHARPDGYFVEDLNSTNETLLNFFRLLPRQLYPLHNGDQLRFGALTALVILA